MDLPDRCPECDCEDIINDNYAYICSDCGNVVSENTSTEGSNNFGKNSSTDQTTVRCNKISFKNKHVDTFCRNYTSSLKTRITNPVKHGVDVIHKICKNLNLPNSIAIMSSDVFKEVSMGIYFKKDSTKSKICLAVLCLYLVSNRENNPITLTELWKNTDCTFNHFGAMLMRLEKFYPQIYPNKSKNIETLVPYYLFKLTLQEREKSIIADYAITLVWMWREALLVQGFNPIYVIYAALYYAWKTISTDRCAIDTKEFCSTVNIEYKPIIRERIHFYLKILQDFYRCSPFYTGEEISQSLITLKLKNMLIMKRIIVWNYNKSEINFHTKRSEYEAVKSDKSNTDITNPEPKGDDNFSDTEIDDYIRTDAEVRDIVNLTNQATC